MTSIDNSTNRLLICLIIAGSLHFLVLLGISISPISDSNSTVEIIIKWAPDRVKEQGEKVADTQIAVESMPKNTADSVEDDEKSSPKARQKKPINFLEGEHLAKRVARSFQQSSSEKNNQRVNEQLLLVLNSYLTSWDRKCERLGRSNFGSNQSTGVLTIELTLLSDGRLKQAQVVDSSRVVKLDTHALKTIERAAPHIPFPPEMRKNYYELTFQRTWQYGSYGTRITPG